jgi:hypothetical protein
MPLSRPCCCCCCTLPAAAAAAVDNNQGDDEKPPYPELFTHLSHATQAHPAGSRSVVGSLDSFKESFAALTGGIFEGVDWSNMVVAGALLNSCRQMRCGQIFVSTSLLALVQGGLKHVAA